MAATSTLFPTTVASTTGTTWTTTTNATGSGTGTTSAAWAVFTNATNGGSGGTGTINLSGYAAQSAGPASGDTIDSVVLSLRGNVAATARWTAASCTAQLFDGTTAIGSPVAIGALSTSTSNVWTVTFTGANAPSYAQLSDLRVRVTAVHTSTTSSTFNVDTAGLVVNYSTPPPPGPKIDTFVDDFATLDSAKWTSAANASVVSGSLNLATSATYQGLVSVNRYDLTGSSIYVEVPHIAVATAGSNTTVDTEFSLVLDGSNRLTFVKEATTLFLQRQVAGTGTDVAIPTYDATAMRWWRIAESGGTVTWSTSPDGTTWTSRGTWAAAGLDLTAFQVRLITGFYGTTTAADAAIIDNVNVAPATTVTGVGALTTQPATLAGAGAATVTGTGGLTAATATLAGAGTLRLTGSGAAAATAATLSGAGALRVTGAGTPTAAPATLTGAGSLAVTGASSLAATPASVSGAGAATVTGTGALAATPATLAGTGTERLTGTGALSPSPATLSGSGTVTSPGVVGGTGALTAPAAGMSGAGTLKVVGAGQLAAQAATLAASALLSLAGAGTLGAPPSGLSGDGAVTAPVAGSGVLVAVQASLTGTGTVVDPSAPIVLAGPLETLTVGADNRTTLIGGQARTVEVGGEVRRFQVHGDPRTELVPAALDLVTAGS